MARIGMGTKQQVKSAEVVKLSRVSTKKCIAISFVVSILTCTMFVLAINYSR